MYIVHCIQFGEFHTATLFNILHRQLCEHLRYTIILYLDRSPFSGTVLLDSWLLLTGAGLQYIYLGEFYTGTRFNRQHRIALHEQRYQIHHTVVFVQFTLPRPCFSILLVAAHWSWSSCPNSHNLLQVFNQYQSLKSMNFSFPIGHYLFAGFLISNSY